jgi:GH24 family phage-related lysozyme (muramidase)
MKVTPIRLFAGAVALSAAGLAATALHEDFVGTATIPTKNDRCTNGFGSTFKEDGSPVKCGETITPPQAIVRALTHIAKDEAGIKACVTGALSQKEYDLLVDFAYQYGVAATCKSSIVRHINAGNYAQACEAYTQYKYSGGYDCSTPGNRICAGVYTRSLARRDACKAAL